MNYSLNINGTLISLDKPKVMGIINATPDSFYKGSRSQNIDEALKKADLMLNEGADFLDIGGYSSRPGADDISINDEIKRTQLIIEAIKKEFPDSIISIDTFRSQVAKVGIESGADIINDISGGELDKEMFDLVGELKVPYIMMHMKGTPQNMVDMNTYENMVHEIIDYFNRKVKQLLERGVKDIIIDPGFGFAKNIKQNYELLNKLNQLSILERPVLVGLSRKSMIYKSLGVSSTEALNGTSVLNTLALERGANILRVHDVKEAVEVVKLVDLTYN